LDEANKKMAQLDAEVNAKSGEIAKLKEDLEAKDTKIK